MKYVPIRHPTPRPAPPPTGSILKPFVYLENLVENGADHQSASDVPVCAVNEVNNLRNYYNMGAVMQKAFHVTTAISNAQAFSVAGRMKERIVGDGFLLIGMEIVVKIFTRNALLLAIGLFGR